MIRTSLAALTIAGLAATSYASDSFVRVTHELAAYDVAAGTVESVDVAKNQFTIKVADRSQTVTITKDTAFMLDGQTSTRDAVLKTGAHVSVTHTAGTATRVEGKSKAFDAFVYDTAAGTVESVDAAKNQFSLKVGERTETITLTKDTTFTLDGAASTRDAVLKPGAHVSVTHAAGTASKVEGRSKAFDAAVYDVSEGTVESVDAAKNQFSLKVGERTQTVTLTKDTTFTLDGQVSTREAVLKTGAKVAVTHTGGTATRVEAKSK